MLGLCRRIPTTSNETLPPGVHRAAGSAAAYFEQIDQFLRLALGDAGGFALPDHR